MNVDDVSSPFLNVVGTDESETVIAFFGNSVVHALNGDDIIKGSDGNDVIYASDGNDKVYGNGGDDYIDGGAGNDYLEGGSGNDTYVYGKGYGNDTIYDYSGTNRIRFVGLEPSDMSVFYPANNSHAILTITETGETLTIEYFRNSQSYRNFTLEFDDGTTGIIDLDSSEIIIENESEEDTEQIGAELLESLYEDDTLLSDFLTEDSTVIDDVIESVTLNEESDDIADMTDIQAMLLAENMSAFGDDSQISDSMDMTDMTADTFMTDSLLVGSLQ